MWVYLESLKFHLIFFLNISCEFKHVTNISNLFIALLFKVCAHFCQTKTHEREESVLLLIPTFRKCFSKSTEVRYVLFLFLYLLVYVVQIAFGFCCL